MGKWATAVLWACLAFVGIGVGHSAGAQPFLAPTFSIDVPINVRVFEAQKNTHKAVFAQNLREVFLSNCRLGKDSCETRCSRGHIRSDVGLHFCRVYAERWFITSPVCLYICDNDRVFGEAFASISKSNTPQNLAGRAVLARRNECGLICTNDRNIRTLVGFRRQRIAAR